VSEINDNQAVNIFQKLQYNYVQQLSFVTVGEGGGKKDQPDSQRWKMVIIYVQKIIEVPRCVVIGCNNVILMFGGKI
jgi:hypothetical protein